MASVVAALAIAPGAASATVTQSQINSPTSGEYLMSYDNQGTTVSVSGTAVGTGAVDIVCYYGVPPSQYEILDPGVPVTNGAFTVSPVLRPIASHACRLRAVPAGLESSSDKDVFAGPQIAVSESALTQEISGGPNNGKAYNFYVNGTTFTGTATWGPASSCGPYVAPLDLSFGIANYPIDCMGSLLSTDLGVFGGRSEVQVDGRDAYDAYSAQQLFAGSQNLAGFPSLSAQVTWNPSDGQVASQSMEGWVSCNDPLDVLPTFPANSSNCQSFAPSGVQLERDIGTSNGGQVVTVTDTWSSTDGAPHTVDLLYDDYAGLPSSVGNRSYQFPGQADFTPYGAGDSLPGPGAAPGSILVQTPDVVGGAAGAVGAITFSNAPSEFGFASNNEFEEHQVLQVPAGGTASLTYIYSVGYTVAAVEAEALAAQDRIEAPALAIASPASGTTVSSPTVTLTGTATSGSGIASLLVAGQPATLVPGGGWTSQVALTPGANTINAVMVDGAGEVSQAQIAVNYQAPAGQPPPPPPSPKAACKVPKTKGKKLAAAEKAVRNAHCKVGKVKKLHSKKVKKGLVISTSPPAGRKLASGWKIELFVSSGPPPPSRRH